MVTPQRSWRQFSLREMLGLMLLVAVMLAAWRATGAMALWGLPAAGVVAAAAGGPYRARKWAWGFSAAVVYGPFAAMGVYALLFVDCSHCKAAVWTLFPAAPGILPVGLMGRWLDLPRPPDSIEFLAGMVCSAVLLAAVAWIVRRQSRWLRATGVAATLAYGTFAAIVLLAIIRA
jgi:hypothetical protein